MTCPRTCCWPSALVKTALRNVFEPMSFGSTPLGVSHTDGSSLVIQHGDWAALWLAEVTLRVQPPKGATGFLPWRLVVAKAAAPPIKAEAESRRNFNLIDLRVNKQSWFMIPGVVTMSWYDSIPIVSQSSAIFVRRVVIHDRVSRKEEKKIESSFVFQAAAQRKAFRCLSRHRLNSQVTNHICPEDNGDEEEHCRSS